MDKLAIFICQFGKIGFRAFFSLFVVFYCFFVCYGSNVYDYDIVVCVNQKDLVLRLGMHFWVWQ
jgi:hypothetical protein